MKTNIFLNSYQQYENKLTYNFLSIVELLNSKKLCEFLSELKLIDNPVSNIQLLYGGGLSNPDGSFQLTTIKGSKVTVYFENKTHRLGLSVEQLKGHLNRCKDNEDILLVITPRSHDYQVVKGMCEPKIKFYTWTEIANYMKKEFYDNIIIQQFLEYGKVKGEFEELGDLSKDELMLHYLYLKINFEARLNRIFNDFCAKLDLGKYGFNKIKKDFLDDWGRKGIEINYNMPDFTYGQWWAISYYFDSYDHVIPFKEDVPEIAVFFDVNPDYRLKLEVDKEFNRIVEELKGLGFESNLFGELTENKWRLLVYRKPITGMASITVDALLKFTEEVFSLLPKSALSHPYFAEFK